MRSVHMSMLRFFVCVVSTFAAALLLARVSLGQEEFPDLTTPAVEGETEPTQVNAQELLEKAEAAYNEGDFQAALDLYEQLLRGIAQSAGQLDYQSQLLLSSLSYTGRARALAGMQEYDAALEDFNKVLTDQPNFFPALISRGQMYLDVGAPDQAIADFQEAVKLQRSNLDAQFGLGKALVQLGAHQQAIKPLDRVIEAQPENAEAYRLRGSAKAGVFKFDDAQADLEKAISLDPEDHESHFMLGVVHFQMENHEQAVEHFGNAIENYTPKPGQEDQPFVQGYLTRSTVHIEHGKKAEDEATKKAAYQGAVDEAEKLLAQLHEKNPAHAPARAAALQARGVGERMLGQIGKAIHTFSEAIELNPDLAEAYYRRGICYHLLGEDKMAISDFVESANINFEDPRANLWEGYTWAKLGDYYEAIRAYGDAIAASDRYTPAYMNRGLAYMALGENEKAIADFDDAIRLEPANANYYFNRGVAYERMGEHDKASASFASAIEFDNKHAAAHRHMADVLRQLGHGELASQYSQRATELSPPQE